MAKNKVTNLRLWLTRNSNNGEQKRLHDTDEQEERTSPEHTKKKQKTSLLPTKSILKNEDNAIFQNTIPVKTSSEIIVLDDSESDDADDFTFVLSQPVIPLFKSNEIIVIESESEDSDKTEIEDKQESMFETINNDSSNLNSSGEFKSLVHDIDNLLLDINTDLLSLQTINLRQEKNDVDLLSLDTIEVEDWNKSTDLLSLKTTEVSNKSNVTSIVCSDKLFNEINENWSSIECDKKRKRSTSEEEKGGKTNSEKRPNQKAYTHSVDLVNKSSNHEELNEVRKDAMLQHPFKEVCIKYEPDLKKDIKVKLVYHRTCPLYWNFCRAVFPSHDNNHNISQLVHEHEKPFYDHSLFVQENYLNIRPKCYKSLPLKMFKKRILLKATFAAEAMSIGDLISAKCEQTDDSPLVEYQDLFLSVLPGHYIRGKFYHEAKVPSWPTQNLRTIKYDMLFKQIHLHTCTITGTNKMACKLDYLVHLRNAILVPLKKGVNGIDEAIEAAISYNLSAEDFDSLVTLTKLASDSKPSVTIDRTVKHRFLREYAKRKISYPFLEISNMLGNMKLEIKKRKLLLETRKNGFILEDVLNKVKTVH